MTHLQSHVILPLNKVCTCTGHLMLLMRKVWQLFPRLQVTKGRNIKCLQNVTLNMGGCWRPSIHNHRLLVYGLSNMNCYSPKGLASLSFHAMWIYLFRVPLGISYHIINIKRWFIEQPLVVYMVQARKGLFCSIYKNSTMWANSGITINYVLILSLWNVVNSFWCVPILEFHKSCIASACPFGSCSSIIPFWITLRWRVSAFECSLWWQSWILIKHADS